MHSNVEACYFGLDETNRCHGNECDVPRNMLFFSLLHNSWYLQEQEAILLRAKDQKETAYDFLFCFFAEVILSPSLSWFYDRGCEYYKKT
jgi:hypothetical protein